MGKKNKKKEQAKKTSLPSKVSVTGTTLVDIVIPVRGRFDLLERCVASIYSAFPGISYNIIIVDNNSAESVGKDVAMEFYRKLENSVEELTVIRNNDNPGFSASCNQGARRKSSPIIFFLNSDIILDPGSGSLLIQSLDDPAVGIVGMKLRFAEEGDYVDAGLNPSIRPAGKLQHAGLSVNVNGDVYHPYLGWDTDHPRINAQRAVFAVTGAALMLRRNTFLKAGGFYEGYEVGTYEDVDLCMMVRDQGQEVIVNPAAEAVHYTGATVEQLQFPYPLNQNASLFRSRWMNKLIWWDFFQL